MAQTQRNQDSISYNGDQTLINRVRSNIQTGSVIDAEDINDIIDLMNAWDNHTHTYTDMYQTATFGNTGDRNTYTENKTTAQHDEASSNVGAISRGNTITASKHNEMKNVVNKLRVHFHNINDRTS